MSEVFQLFSKDRKQSVKFTIHETGVTVSIGKKSMELSFSEAEKWMSEGLDQIKLHKANQN